MEKFTSGLYTDFYELTMAQGYLLNSMEDKDSVFDLYFRSNPFDGGYAVFAGLEDAIKGVMNFSYSTDEIEYLRKLGFKSVFLKYLENFSFSGSIYAFREGDIVFQDDILLRVQSNIIEAQLLESILLNIINYQTLAATKARRIIFASGGKTVVDFGLRRAQGKASISGARAAFIGGVSGTSNTLAAKIYGIPAIGTHAHSWVQSFDNELLAFRKYVEIYPDNSTLLVDTYDTLKSGLPNAIIVAKELERQGKKLNAIRLDSGDLAYFSKKARKLLDDEDLRYVKIVVSNQLDEYLVDSLLDQNSPIDMFGIGTKLICSYDQPALDGVYKIAQYDNKPTLKFSENIEKINNPGKKKVVRFLDERGKFLIDGLLLDNENEDIITLIRHPAIPFKKVKIKFEMIRDKVFYPIVEDGKLVYKFPEIRNIQNFSAKRFEMLSDSQKRFTNPHTYRVGVSNDLYKLREDLIRRRSENFN